MNKLQLATIKLEELLELAQAAVTGFEKAAVFSATRAITLEFSGNEEGRSAYVLEQVSSTAWSICAIVGYDLDNGHDTAQHVSWARSHLDTLRTLIK